MIKILEKSNKEYYEKLESMLKLQKKLNDETNGENWEFGITKNGKQINWLRCIHMEIGELIESTPWKHWKNIDKPSDIENIKIELVDIWHFLMSYTLQETNVAKSIISINEKCKYDTKKSFEAIDVINQSEDLMYLTLSLMTNNCTYENEIENLISKFFKCCEACTLSLDELYNFYIGKNCLNKFRQDNGYKSGDYVKIWNKKEDNVVMMQILENSKSITFDELYLQLECEYKKI